MRLCNHCAKCRSLPKDEFKRESRRNSRGGNRNRGRSFTLKVYKSQIPVVEQAIETAGLMLGTDKSRGYCPE